jgi:hypothetical protein
MGRIGIITSTHYFEKGKDMKRLRHVAFRAQQREREHIQADEQQVRPIYDAIAQAVHKWDLLGLTKFDDLAYEDTVLWLLQHLHEAHDFHSVERLIVQAFAEQQGSSQCDPEDILRLQALAEDMWHAWSQYLQRHDQSTFAQARSRARGLMGRHYYPRTNNRSGLAS